MKFEGVEIGDSGILAGANFTRLAGGVNVVYGSNGSGKTTWLRFVRGVFCGQIGSRQRGNPTPADGEQVRGSLHVRLDGQVIRLSRPSISDPIKVVSVRDDRAPLQHNFDIRLIRDELVGTLHTASGAEGHSIDQLLQQALADGIRLATPRENSARLNQAAADVHHERVQLRGDAGDGHLAELAEQRQCLQSEIAQLSEQLRHRCGEWGSPYTPPVDETLRSEVRVTWLREELACAQCDLREAEDLYWECQHTRPEPLKIPRPQRQFTAPVAAPRHDHITVRRIPQLKQLERRIDHLRGVLAETAQARLDISLGAARIAGTNDVTTGPFLKQLRQSVEALEMGALELQETTESLSEECESGECQCHQWETSNREVAGELRKRVYQLCEEVSRYELHQEKAVLKGAIATIDDCEVALRSQIEALITERDALLDTSQGLRAWSTAQRRRAERDQCHCLEHDSSSQGTDRRRRGTWRSCIPAAKAIPVHPGSVRPTCDDLNRLTRRRDELRDELETAVSEWRDVRKRPPSFALPEDLIALECQIDEKRMKLSAIETALAKHHQRWQVLSVTGEVIRRVAQRIERSQLSDVIRWASQNLRRLTGGRLVEINISPQDHEVSVTDEDGRTQPMAALSRGTWEQLDLSLRLALVRAYRVRGIQFPLVLDDVLADTDQQRLRAAVELLSEFAEKQDQQIIYLTCQAHLAELFERHGALVRTMPGSTRMSHRAVVGCEAPAGAIRGWVDRASRNEVIPAEPTTIQRPRPAEHVAPIGLFPETAPLPVSHLKPLKRRQPDGPYWLSSNSPVDLVPSIGSQMGRRLARLGVVSAAALIALDPEELHLRLAGLQISPERLSDWRAEAELLCRVPDLTGTDAQLLVFSGFGDIEALSRSSVDDVLKRIRTIASGKRIRSKLFAVPSSEVVQRWIHNSRRAIPLQPARSRSRSPQRTNPGEEHAGALREHGPRLSESPTVRSLSTDCGAASSEVVDPEYSNLGDTDNVANEIGTVIKPFVLTSAPRTEEGESSDLRFYLSPTSPVVDAPSIGPTTSRRLEKIGILTVGDLLNREAGEIASRLKNRRVKADAVLLWQQQARLMCRIPKLRGHDAQVLIACGVTEPEQLARMDAADLFAIVGPFVNTKEGQRLLRSSNTPDLEEVTDWINWSRHSRQLRAA